MYQNTKMSLINSTNWALLTPTFLRRSPTILRAEILADGVSGELPYAVWRGDVPMDVVDKLFTDSGVCGGTSLFVGVANVLSGSLFSLSSVSSPGVNLNFSLSFTASSCRRSEEKTITLWVMVFFLMTTCNLLQQSSCDVTFWSVASLKKMVFSSYSWHISIIAAMFVKMKHHYCLCYSYSNQAETGVLKEVCDTYIEGVWRATVQWVNVFKFSKTLKLASHLLLHLWVSALTPEVFLSHQVHSPESRFVQ